jgi:ABC-type phosphate transport system auxiliary subunit
MSSLLEQLRLLKEKVEEQLQSIERDDLNSSKDEQLSQLNVAGEGLKTLRLETTRSATSLPSHSLLQVQEVCLNINP